MYKNKEDYPLTMEPKEVQEILRMGRKRTYEFISEVEIMIKKGKKPPFTVKRVGKLYKIPRDSFFKWFESDEAGA